MDRRSFIKLTAITGTSATLASCGNPEHQVIRFLPEDEITPGVAEWKPSVCPLCASGCGLTVRVMDADVDVTRDGQAGVVRMAVAKKLEGNPQHPVNHGRLCARGQSAIQVTYHPDRITRPLKRSGERGSGRFEEVTWDQAIGDVVTHLDQIAQAGDQRSFVYLRLHRPGMRASLVDRFMAAFGGSEPVTADLLTDDVLRRACALAFGRYQVPTFDLARTRFVLSFGADFLGTWNSPVAQAVAYGDMRQGRPGIRGAFVQIEPRMSQTGANADQWIPVKPGTEGVLALGLAHVILANKLAPGGQTEAARVLAGWSAGLPEYTPDRVAGTTGVPAARIERLARDFAATSPAVAIVGGAPLAHTNGLFTATAVQALNLLAGSVGRPGGLFFTPAPPLANTSPAAATDGRSRRTPGETSRQTVGRLAAGILSGERRVQMLVVDGANPVYASPPGWRVREAIGRVPFIVSVGNFVDETSAHADLILPDHTFLESWTDAVPESGSLVPVISLAPPVMRPLYSTRATPDVLLEVAQRLKKPLPFMAKTYQDFLKESFSALPGSEGDAWSAIQKQGGWWGQGSTAGGDTETPVVPAVPVRQLPRVAEGSVAYAAAEFDGDASQYPFHFLPVASSTFLDGSLAHLPWLQEMPDPLTSAMWSSWLEINPATAARLGISEGDLVEVTSRHGMLRTSAILTPGIAPDIIAMPMGQGHEMFTRFATGRGANPVAVLASAEESSTGTLAWASTRVRLARVGGPDGRLILFAGEKHEHPNEGRR